MSFAALKNEEHEGPTNSSNNNSIPRVESSTGYWTRHDSSPSLYQGTPIYWDEQEGLSPGREGQPPKPIVAAEEVPATDDGVLAADADSSSKMKRVESSTGYWTRHDSTPSLYQGQSVYWDEQEGLRGPPSNNTNNNNNPSHPQSQQQQPSSSSTNANPPPTLTPSNSTASLKSAVTSSTNYWKRQDSNASMYKQFYWDGESENAQEAITEAVQQAAAKNMHPNQPQADDAKVSAADDTDSVPIIMGRPNRSESVASSGFLFYDEGSTVAGPAPGDPLVMMTAPETTTNDPKSAVAAGMTRDDDQQSGGGLIIPTTIDHSRNLTHAVSSLSLAGEAGKEEEDVTPAPEADGSTTMMKRSPSTASTNSGVTSSTNYWKRTDSTPSMYKPIYWDQEEE